MTFDSIGVTYFMLDTMTQVLQAGRQSFTLRGLLVRAPLTASSTLT